MLVRWKYKVCKTFATQDDGLHPSASALVRTKPRPNGVKLYKVSQKSYDYVDYTGKFKGEEVDASDLTCILEFLGYIKFVDKQYE